MSSWEAEGQSNDWYTPAYILEALGVVFDLDVAAPQEGPRHVPCHNWYYWGSLERPWNGFVWMNPPFGARNGLEPWLEKFVQHGNGIALTPDRTSAPWFQSAAPYMSSLLFLSPKVKFERPDGSVGKSPGTGTVLMARGARADDALYRAKHLGWLCKQVPARRISEAA